MDLDKKYLAVLGPEGGVDFPIQLKVEEDIEGELTEFVRLSRRSEFKEAREFFDVSLRNYLGFFPVLAEYADMLLDQGAYRELSDVLHQQIDRDENNFEPEDVRLLRAFLALARVYTDGTLEEAVVEAKDWPGLLKAACNNRKTTDEIEVRQLLFFCPSFFFSHSSNSPKQPLTPYVLCT